MPEICVGYDAHSGYECERTASVVVTAGCIHEHAGPRDLCGLHLDDVQIGNMICGNCHEIDGHRCVLHEMAREAVTSA